MKQIDFDALVHSVSYWLSYQDRIGRAFMIQESSIKFPVADYLTGIGVPLAQITLEFLHPDLKNKRIDLVTTDKPTITPDFSVKSAFEFKIAKEETKSKIEKQRIFNDLMRMYLMSSQQNTKSYFMIVGRHSDYLQFFRNITKSNPKNKTQNIPDDAEGFYTEWFDFNRKASKTFSIDPTLNTEYGNIYKEFLETYEEAENKPQLTLPKTLTTVCIAFVSLIRDTPHPYVGGIWEIKS